MEAADKRSELIDCILEFGNNVNRVLAERPTPKSRVKPATP